METLTRLAELPLRPSVPEPELIPADEAFDDFLGLFEDLRGLIPASFFLLFKIARIIKNPEAKLSGELKGFYDICREADRTAQIESSKTADSAKEVPVLTGHDPQIGTRRIKGIEEISSVLPLDVALEDFTDLLRKAEERQLDVRVLLREGESQASLETAPIHDRGARQMANAAEQKLYILVDRSYSMWNHWRMLFAKVLAIEYLRRKKGSGARLFYRAFDYEVYDIVKIVNEADYDRLIRQLLFIEPGGKGTDIAHAIRTAAQDISFDGMFEGAEILLLTDGMDRIDPAEIKQTLGDKIKLHMLKIGRDINEPQSTEIKDMLEKDGSLSAMSRDELSAHYNKQIKFAWEEVTTTLLETDDLDTLEMQLGDEEVAFALDAAEKAVQVDMHALSMAQAEAAFRKASFVEGFVAFLLDQAEEVTAVAKRKKDLEDALAKINQFKIRLIGLNQTFNNLLAGKDLRFVNDKTLRKEAKKAGITLDDLARMQESEELALKLKLGGAPAAGDEGKGLSLLTLMKMIAKSATKSVRDWLFSGDEAEEEEKPETKKEKKKPKKSKP